MINPNRYVVGDILSAPEGVSQPVIICHQVNCFGRMGAGLAKQIRNKFPEVFSAYETMTNNESDRMSLLGNAQVINVGDNLYVANIFGQYGFGRSGRYTDYIAVMRAFRVIANSYPDAILRIPYKIGCGLGGGDWDRVKSIIETELADVQYEIWRLP